MKAAFATQDQQRVDAHFGHGAAAEGDALVATGPEPNAELRVGDVEVEVREGAVVARGERELGDAEPDADAENREEGGAQLMIKQQALKNPDVGAIFGLHVTSNIHTGHIGYRSGPMMASSDTWKVFLRGTQTHGAMPWRARV